jgi:hypothetical protein
MAESRPPADTSESGAGILQSRWFATPVGVIAAIAGSVLINLVLAGFILGGYLDASGATWIPGVSWLLQLPPPVRTAIQVVVGVPVAFGVALYVITQLLEFVVLITWPFRKLAEVVRNER